MTFVFIGKKVRVIFSSLNKTSIGLLSITTNYKSSYNFCPLTHFPVAMVFIPSILNPAITFGTCRGIIMIRRILSQYATRHVNVIHSEVTNASFNHYIFQFTICYFTRRSKISPFNIFNCCNLNPII